MTEAKADVVDAYARAARATKTEVMFETVPILLWQMFGSKVHCMHLYVDHSPRMNAVFASLTVLLDENPSQMIKEVLISRGVLWVS